MERRHFTHFRIAGFTYYDAPIVFNELAIGSTLRLVPEDNNQYDRHAVAVFYGKYKLGYIPRTDNNAISKLLRQGHTDIFETRVQRISPEESPENQIQAIVYLLPAG